MTCRDLTILRFGISFILYRLFCYSDPTYIMPSWLVAAVACNNISLHAGHVLEAPMIVWF
jgi:hypothetical protein